MKKWYSIINKAGSSAAEIFIYDEIGIWGVTAKDFAAEFKAIPADRAISLHINSPGGSVWDGFAIYNLLKSRGDKVTAYIDGVAASIATIIALGANRVVAAENAMWMIHNPAMSLFAAESDELRSYADMLDKLRDQAAAIYEAKTGKDRDAITGAMDATTWLNAREAAEWGFVDQVSDAIEAAACSRHSAYNFAKPPPAASALATNIKTPTTDTMKKLLAALAAAKLIPSADATDEVAAAQFEAAFAALQDQHKTTADELAATRAGLEEFADKAAADLKTRAESTIAGLVKDGRLKDDASLREKWVNAYIHDEAGTTAMIDSLPEPKAATRGAPPLMFKPAAGAATPPAADLTGRDRAAAAFTAQFKA
jgi:ATP-dependent protease ClpP protease subunit